MGLPSALKTAVLFSLHLFELAVPRLGVRDDVVHLLDSGFIVEDGAHFSRQA